MGRRSQSGEYSALVWSGALSFTDAVDLVRVRAELMQEAVPAGEGAMAAILGLDDDTVGEVCDSAADGQVVSAVNFDSPGQVVIAGQRDAVARAVDGAKAAGAKRALLLRVSVPSHSALMEPAANALADHLAKVSIAQPSIPVVNSVDVGPYDRPDRIRDGLRRQVCNPVRWVQAVHWLRDQGVDTFLECGPGKVLAGLVRRIDRSAKSFAIETPDDLQEALAACRSAS
ncbi:MAG: ACP S-malonyltransferase [Woeseiaceae bacterium]|nr:ACP S-malonyltransferase [Woeseiaceae bacterium]